MLYTFLIVKALTWLCYYDVLFGANAISYVSQATVPFFQKPAFLLHGDVWKNLPLVFISGVLGITLLLLFLRRLPLILSFGLSFLLWLLIINLHHKIYPGLTGGNFLLNQFLFFNCFLSFSYTSNNTWQSETKKLLHNFATLAIIIQVSLAYFLSALAKLNDLQWMQGTAIAQTLQIHHYSLFSSTPILPGLALKFLNFFILFYQLVFPLLWFFRKLKKVFLLLGILMHLYIAFIMGLIDFGLIMILGYVYFWPVKRPNS